MFNIFNSVDSITRSLSKMVTRLEKLAEKRLRHADAAEKIARAALDTAKAHRDEVDKARAVAAKVADLLS